MTHIESLASLAASMGLSVAGAVVLPTAITVASKKAGMSESKFIWNLQTNLRLREYVAQICEQVAS